MKFLKYVVVSNANSIGLFPTVVKCGLFDGFFSAEVVPSFGNEPVLYRRSHAKFLARELRRAGYYVSARPYVLYMLRNALMAFRERLFSRKAARAAWKK